MLSRVDFKSRILRLAVLSALGLFATPASAVDPLLMRQAENLLALCLEKMPDTAAIRRGYKDAGLRDEGQYGGYFVYANDGYRIFAGVAAKVSGDPDPECMVLVDKMTPAEASRLMAPIAKSGKARPVKKPYSDRLMTEGWVFTIRGVPAMLAAYRDIDFYYAVGTMVVLHTKLTPIKK